METGLIKRHPKAFKAFSVSLHAFATAHFWFGCYYDWVYVRVPPSVAPIYAAYGYKLKFLTYWDALLQASYFTLCLTTDIVVFLRPDAEGSKKLCRAKDYLMASLGFPIAVFVGVTFWGLMAVDRELVLPKVLDAYFPSWLNHVMHTNIVLFQLLEMMSSSREYPSKKYSLPLLFGFQSTYLSWMFFVHYKSGLWVYPVFDVLNAVEKTGFIAGSILAGFGFYYIGERLNKLLWESETDNRGNHRNVRYHVT